MPKITELPAVANVTTADIFPLVQTGTTQRATLSQIITALTANGVASSGANSSITSLSGLTTPLTVAQGGTGGGDAATARTNLGLGTIATQNSNAIAVTGGTMTGVPINLGTPVNFSGTTTTFSSIPSWVTRITISIAGMSTNGTNIPLVQLGDSGGLENTGYSSGAAVLANGLSTAAANSTAGFVTSGAWSAATTFHGTIVLTLLNASTNLWSCFVCAGATNTPAAHVGGGTKALSATLDRIAITTNSADTFDAGSVNIQFE